MSMSRLMVVEHKTTSEDCGAGSVYWRRLSMDPQCVLYADGARSLGYDVVGILYDVLRKPQLEPLKATPVEVRKYTKATATEPSRLYANQRDKDETPEEYGTRVLDAIKEAPDKFFQRGVVSVLEDERKENSADVWQTAQAMRDARRLKVYPRNPDACVQWSRACEYLAVCCGEAKIDDPFLFRKEEQKHSELEYSGKECSKCGQRGGFGEMSDCGSGGFHHFVWKESLLELLTQSSFRAFRSCHRKYFYRYELQMRPITVKVETLRMGTSLHRGLETLWLGEGLERAISVLDGGSADPHRFDANGFLKDDPSYVPDMYAHHKERAMLVAYVARWGAPTGVLAVEKEWQMDLINPETGAKSKTFRLGGKIDAVAEVS